MSDERKRRGQGPVEDFLWERTANSRSDFATNAYYNAAMTVHKAKKKLREL